MVGVAASYLQPSPSDETCHPPGDEHWWNESWYFDAVSDEGDLGLYMRIGRVPKQGQALMTASVVRTRQPAIMLVSVGPLPALDDPSQVVDVPGLHAEHHCQIPLQRFQVRLEGVAEAHADHAAPLREAPGTSVEIAFAATWDTDGLAYTWRRSTRYEIPCRVSGTVTINGERRQFTGPGQRDHSWGVRDWFASDWMWCGLHLDDGTHAHAVSIPGRPDLGVGYVQREGQLTELVSVESTERVGGDGLIVSASVRAEPGEVRLEAEPLGFGAVLLKAPDGRTSEFPRAMCRVRTADGGRGVGWIEWNRNRK